MCTTCHRRRSAAGNTTTTGSAAAAAAAEVDDESCDEATAKRSPPNSHTVVYIRRFSSVLGWRRGVVDSGVRRMNEVNARRARLVPGWVTVCGRVSRYVTSQLGQLSIAYLRGR